MRQSFEILKNRVILKTKLELKVVEKGRRKMTQSHFRVLRSNRRHIFTNQTTKFITKIGSFMWNKTACNQ